VGWPLWAVAPTLTNLSVTVTDRSALIRATSSVTSGDACRVAYDYDNVALDRRSRQVNRASANGGRVGIDLYDLAPATQVYFELQCSDPTKTDWTSLTCPGTFSNGGSGDWSILAANSDVDCVTGEFPSFTTSAADSDPAPDPPSSSAMLTPPTVTGSTFTVAANCSDFATQKAAAEADAATAPGFVSELVIPAGSECALAGATGFGVASIGNGGVVIVRSGADPKLLPPNSALIDKTSLPFLAKLTWSEYPHLSSSYHAFIKPIEADARGYYFYNLRMGPPDLDTLSPVDLTIIGIDTTTETLTASSSISGIYNGQTVVVDLTGTGVRGGQGIMQICAISGATFKLTTGVTAVTSGSGCGTVVNLVGTYGSGGTVRRMVALPIEAHTSSGGNHALTITGHKIPNYLPMTITGSTASNNTATSDPVRR